jgi:VanZ family protein
MMFLRYWLPLISYAVLIFIQSHHSVPEEVPSWTFLDKVLHMAGYGLFGALFYRAYGSRRKKYSTRRLAITSVVATVLYGLSDEVHQYFVPFRTADPLDLLADAIGGVIGVLVYRAISPFIGSEADSHAIDKKRTFR